MRVFECDPGMEISGNLAIALLLNLQAKNFQPFLEKYGLADVKADQWYSFQDLLNVFKEVSRLPNSMFDFVAVGMAAIDRYDLPAEIESMSLEDFCLNIMPGMFNRNYRNGTATRVNVRKVADKHLLIRTATAYPDDTVYGFMYGFARRFMKGSHFTLKYDEHHTRHDFGGDDTIIHLKWD